MATMGLSRRSSRRTVLVATLASGALLVAAPALAARWALDSGVSSELTWSDNPTLASSGGRDDVGLTVRPRISLLGEGARLRLSGTAALNAVTYARDTLPSRALPEADLNGRLEAIERLFFVEAGFRALQTSDNPFGIRPEAGSTQNTLTTTQTRLSPSIESSPAPNLRYRVRSDNTWTRDSGSTTPVATSTAAGYFARHSALIEQDPAPLGWRLEAERSYTRYDDLQRQPLTLDLARFSVDYALTSELSAGVRVGHERVDVEGVRGEGTVYGVQMRWQPSPRTTLSAFQEERFFGSNWRLAFDHRSPRYAWSIVTARAIDTTPQSIFELPAAQNVASLLDAMFTTRYPDPIERARVVQDFIARQGLPTSTLGPIGLFAQRLSLVTLHNASFSLIGVRSTLVFSAFRARTEDASETTAIIAGGVRTNNQQTGGAITLTHRLSAAVSLVASVDRSRIQALDASLSDRSTQTTARLRANVQASRKTTAYIGARHREIESTVVTEGAETAAFVGLDHRF